MIPYVLHVALLLSICLLFYKLLLQKETYYGLNRLILLGCLAMAFLLPLIHVPRQWALRESAPAAVLQSIPVVAIHPPRITPAASYNPQPQVKAAPVNVTPAQPQTPVLPRIIKWAFYLYWFGVIAFGANLLLQICVLLVQAYRKPAIIDGKYRIIELDDDKAPCSFGNNIFINPGKYDFDTYSQILLHEKIHVKQGHSLDLLLAELMLAFQWFNPFAWLYRKEVESNLEYLADNEVLHDASVQRDVYQMNLLKVSVPNLSLRITTNYNQSLLKKRIVMMNAKRSNIHTAWKYLFLMPLMALLVCVLNQPVAMSQDVDAAAKARFNDNSYDRNTGHWSATIKGKVIQLNLSSGDSNNSMSMGEDFQLTELTGLPKGKNGEFKMTREAGTMIFTGRFDGNSGSGTYKFNPDPSLTTYLKSQGISPITKDEPIAFSVINLNKAYLQMLRNNGYKNIIKDDLIASRALKVDEPYIHGLKQAGYTGITLQQLVTGKALGITPAFVSEIHKAGYPNADWDKLVTFKAQGINGDYISKFKNARGAVANKKGKPGKKDDDEDDMVAYKSLGVDDAYVNSFKKVGYTNLSSSDLVSMKAMGITAEFVQGFKNAGYGNISHDEIVSLKALDITPEYLNGFKNAGYRIDVQKASSFKALGITPEYLNGFKAAGYKNINTDNVSGLKALGVTPEFIKGFKAIGFNNISLEDATSLKATGVTPEYISQMREKGFKSDDINKYITLKNAF